MPQNEPLLTLAQAAAWMETELGLRRSPGRLWEWVTRGVGGVRLEACFVAGKWHTRAGAIRRFISNTTREQARRYGAAIEELRA